MTRQRTNRDADNERLRRIVAVTDAALSGLQLDELLAELLERTRELLAVDTATILLVDEDGKDLVATASTGLEEEVRRAVRVPIGEGFAGRIAAEGRPVTLDHVDTSNVISQVILDKHLTSMVGVPMRSPDRIIGVLHVGAIRSRTFSPEDIELLRLVADRAAMASQARLSQLDRASALALQRSLLPERLPQISGLEVAARYIPGTQAGVGGDWYDLFPLPSCHVGIVIGDVAGNGLRAAVVMGRIRSALRAYAMETNDPADALTRLDHKIQVFELGAMATAIYAVLDPTHTTVTMSVAGHLPPILIEPVQPRSTAGPGTAKPLNLEPDLPLGAHHGSQRTATTIRLAPGATLLLYTDGLIERRDRPLDRGIHELTEAATGATVDDLCTHITDRLLPGQAPTDDVAILAVRRSATPTA